MQTYLSKHYGSSSTTDSEETYLLRSRQSFAESVLQVSVRKPGTWFTRVDLPLSDMGEVSNILMTVCDFV
eukprot:m.330293 g.330293  ORF g.330293 m.330293 type:complete len:70 (+) comp16580_c0_seq3:929-1138(+)